MKFFTPARALAALSVFGSSILTASAIDLDPTQPDQVKSAAKTVADQLVSLYAKNGTNGYEIISGIPGLLTYPPYYWWEAGAMFQQLIDYWYYTNDSSYNSLVKEGILHQIGEQQNLMPSNQSKDEGNDDQLFWAFTVMSAAELGFEDPDASEPGWLALAQGVLNQLLVRVDNSTCNGGLRWQIYQWIDGYTYKNLAANGGMFQLAARLARYTGNSTYAEIANTAYNWLAQSPLITKDYQIYDGTDVLKKCVSADQTQWTYNYGIMIAGAAYMYNATNGTEQETWKERLSGFLNHTGTFFPADKGGVMVEICEPSQKCNIDQWSFKASFSRWLAITAGLAPYTQAQIMPLLQKSATAAAKQCSGNGNQCGSRWYQDFDGNTGVGQQMSALSVIQANLITQSRAPYSADTGGTSKGNPSAGTGDTDVPVHFDPVTTGDKAGAAILTILVLGMTIGGSWWLVS